MPFKSEAQRRYLYAKHPEIAKRWSRKYGDKPVGKSNMAVKRYPSKQHKNVGIGDLAMARMKKRASNSQQDSPLSGPQQSRMPVQGGSNVNMRTGNVQQGPNSRQAARMQILKRLASQRRKK